jgi:uncharacterized protein YggE
VDLSYYELVFKMLSGKFKVVSLALAVVALSAALVILTANPPKTLKTAAGEVGENRSTLSVSGLGIVTVKPDQVSVSLTVETEAENASEALSENSELMNKVINAIKKLGLEDKELKTATLNIYPQYFYPTDKPPVLTGYKAVNTIIVTTKKLEIVGLLIDTATANGINRIEGVWFSISNELMNSTKLTLISMAVEDAKRKAEAALKPLKMSIIGVKSIEIVEVSGYEVTQYRALSTTSETTPILPGEAEIAVTVHVVFYIG